MTLGAAAPAASRKRRRWPVVMTVLAVIAVVTAAAVLLVVWWKRDAGADAGAAWQPPPQTFLSSSMRDQPVPGWRTTLADLGLPVAHPGGTAPTRIATSDDPFNSGPYVGSLGAHAYFIAGSPGAEDSRWWLLGIDAATGQRLFAPVPLSVEARPPDCYLNGSDFVLCVTGGADSATAWVIDADSGVVTHTGPTDLRTHPGTLGVRQVGIYAVAQSMNQGVYGIGPTAETTWFVPGDGSVDERLGPATNVAPLTLATQTAAGRGSDRMIVFSLATGEVIDPPLDSGLQRLWASVYPGGFALEVADSQRPNRDAVLFFDDNGNQLGRTEVPGFLAVGARDLPTVHSSPESVVFSPTGDTLAEVARLDIGMSPLLVGSLLFVDESDSFERRWQQYNLRTGAKGTVCPFNMGGFIASDGAIGVFEEGNPNVGRVTRTADLSTCETLWTVTAPAGSFNDMWRVDTTLVQLSDDGTELMSLVAPG